MVDYITATYPADAYSVTLVSFNGANFDDYFVMNYCIEKDIHFEATYSNKSLLGLTTPYFKCWDLKKFLPVGSLASLTGNKGFDVFPKKMNDSEMGFTHNDV